jgi:chemotaxis protein CheD
MNEPQTVGLAEMYLSRNPQDVLVAYGLGSCLGVVMLDPVAKVAGLLHAVLPRATDGLESAESNPYKYVESGIEAMLADLLNNGASRTRLTIRVAGGANMLLSSGLTRSFDIGTRNIEAARSALQRLRLPLAASAVGGHVGRTLRVYMAESRVTVRVAGQKEEEL